MRYRYVTRTQLGREILTCRNGHGGSYIYLFVKLAGRALITAAHYPNCRHFLAASRHPPSSLYARLLATPFATGGGLRKFMGFLHEITRKHNPCPLRRMSPRLRRPHSFRPLPHGSSLSLRSFAGFLGISSALPPSPFADRSIAKLAGSFTEFDPCVLALART